MPTTSSSTRDRRLLPCLSLMFGFGEGAGAGRAPSIASMFVTVAGCSRALGPFSMPTSSFQGVRGGKRVRWLCPHWWALTPTRSFMWACPLSPICRLLRHGDACRKKATRKQEGQEGEGQARRKGIALVVVARPPAGGEQKDTHAGEESIGPPDSETVLKIQGERFEEIQNQNYDKGTTSIQQHDIDSCELHR